MSRTDDSPVPDYATLTDLSGRSFLVLGAGQGMGRQAAHALAGCGARTVCVDLDPDLAGDVAAEVDGLPWSGDVTDRAAMEALVAFGGAQFGRIDGIVDIVGLSTFVPLLDIDDDLWRSQFDICLRHAYLAMQIGGRAMAATGGGAMAFVASISGLSAATGHAAYGAAKAGLISLVKSAATELGPLGIRVNAVAPGVTMTPRISARLSDAEKAERAERSPSRRLNEPTDMARVLLFFVSDLSRGVTGQTLAVDGGSSITFPFARERVATFVLVHGGGHGGWCWQSLARELRTRGHEVWTPTLTGFGERSHLDVSQVTFATFVEDVANVLRFEDLHDVVLVGHSMGGVVVPRVAEAEPARIGEVVWLAAVVTRDGERLLDATGGAPNPWLARAVTVGADGTAHTVPDLILDAILQDGTPAQRAFVRARHLGYPPHALVEPGRLSAFLALGLPCGYVVASEDRTLPPATCEGFAALLPGAWRATVPAGHDCMVTQPGLVADALLGRGGRTSA